MSPPGTLPPSSADVPSPAAGAGDRPPPAASGEPWPVGPGHPMSNGLGSQGIPAAAPIDADAAGEPTRGPQGLLRSLFRSRTPPADTTEAAPPVAPMEGQLDPAHEAQSRSTAAAAVSALRTAGRQSSEPDPPGTGMGDAWRAPPGEPAAGDPVASPQTTASENPLHASLQKSQAAAHAGDGQSRRLAYRLETPARFDTGGKSYNTLDWSLGGFALSVAEARFSKGQTLTGTFTVFLDQFVVSTTVHVEVVHIDSRRVGCRFTELSQSQVRMLRSLSAALLSGRTPTSFPVNEKADTPHHAAAKPRKPKPFVKLLSGSFNALLAVIVVGIGLAVFFAPIEPTFQADTGAVAAGSVVLSEEATGALDTLVAKPDETVESGAVIAYFTAIDGTRTPLVSPCDCMLIRFGAEVGEPIASGQPVAQLVTADSKPVVQALFDRSDVDLWRPGRLVSISLTYSGQKIGGRIDRVTETVPDDVIGIPQPLAAAPNKLVAWIEPAVSLPLTAVGEPALVQFAQSTGVTSP